MRGEIHQPGHLTFGYPVLDLVREHAACSLCTKPYTGPPNQVICANCKLTDAGKQFIAERKRKASRRFQARKRRGLYPKR